jgi:hypothetical protein
MLAGAAVAAAAALPVADSGAVVYSSVFDPPDFHGVATFDVADVCLSSDGVKTNNVGGCTITWLTAMVTFPDAPTTFDYAHLLPNSSSSLISEILVEGGELTGVRSSLLGPAHVSGFGSPFDGPWWIQYDFEDPEVIGDSIGPMTAGFGFVYLFGGNCDGEVCFPNPNDKGVATVENFTRLVPEPGTLALVLAALAGGWWTRRRLNAAA